MSDRRGLRDVVAVESRLSAIIDDDLTYRGYGIENLYVHSSFEEVTYLLWFGDPPSGEELAAFRARLAATPPPPAVTAATPALALVAGVLGLAETASADAKHPEYRLLTGIPLVMAGFDRNRRGLEPVSPPLQGSIAGQFLHALYDQAPTAAQTRALDRSFVLFADHELNAATFAARVAASTGADLYSAVLAAVAALSGPLHGGAARATGELLAHDTAEQAIAATQGRLAAGERVPGFGHPVYRRGDPRVPLFRQLAGEFSVATGNARYLETADRVAAVIAEQKGLPPNADLYAAACWLALGIPADLFPAVFALGRMAGWIAHIREQAADNRLIRPRAHYAGPGAREYVPLVERG